MERTKFKPKRKEPPDILIPELSGRILRVLTSNEYQLWNFYRDCAKQQNTDQIRCKYDFIKNTNGLGWTRNRIAKTNKGLIQLGLIELFQRKNGIDWGHSYIKIFFTMEENRLKSAELQRSTYGKSITTKISVSTLNEPANIEKDSVVRRSRSTRTTYYKNALKKHNKQGTCRTIPSGIVPSVQKKDKKDILPLEEQKTGFAKKSDYYPPYIDKYGFRFYKQKNNKYITTDGTNRSLYPDEIKEGIRKYHQKNN